MSSWEWYHWGPYPQHTLEDSLTFFCLLNWRGCWKSGVLSFILPLYKFNRFWTIKRTETLIIFVMIEGYIILLFWKSIADEWHQQNITFQLPQSSWFKVGRFLLDLRLAHVPSFTHVDIRPIVQMVHTGLRRNEACLHGSCTSSICAHSPFKQGYAAAVYNIYSTIEWGNPFMHTLYSDPKHGSLRMMGSGANYG